ncbi:aminotriazole resistance protein [Colletotrichum incanum]|uniref:Aminotriazole resistance protein n=1 Tax=Colletotrichum incanum TaxID=1573173 RepID=A0A166TI75_COLIC|nr:aminotriazole resistance protein [Colletotrichum incanum]
MNDTSRSTTFGPIETPTTEWETRSANAAMQTVADVMIAVTESFRQQFKEQHPNDHRMSGSSSPVGPDLRALAPNVVSPILDVNYDDVNQANHNLSRPITAHSTFDTYLVSLSPVSPVLSTPSHDPNTPTVPAALTLGTAPIPRAPAPNTLNLYGNPDIHIQQPEPAAPPRNQITDIASQRGFAPESLEHPTEYPDLFEAARRIVFTQRSEDNEEHLFGARRSRLYQSQPLLEKASRPQLSSIQETSLVAVVSLYQILTFAGLSQAMAPALDISKSFTDAAAGQHSWFTAAYALTVGVFILPLARLGETFGRKPVIVLGCLWFALWSLFAGFSLIVQKGGNNGTIYFCICRAMQGIGPALCIPNGFSTLERTLAPGQKKHMALSLFSAAAPVGFVIGAVMSSLFAFNAAWEWSFFALAAVCVSAAGLSILVLPRQSTPETHSTNSIYAQLDVSGTILGGSGLGLFSFACNQAPAVGWSTPYTCFLLIIGALLFAAFIYNETVVVDPLLPLGAMGSSTNLILGCTAAAWGCFIVWVFYTFQLLELPRGWTSLLASAGFVPVAVETPAVALLLAYLMPGVEVYWAFLVSVLSFLLASILMATAPPEQTHGHDESTCDDAVAEESARGSSRDRKQLGLGSIKLLHVTFHGNGKDS